MEDLQAFDLIHSKACCLADLVKVNALVGVGLSSHGHHSGGKEGADWGGDLPTWPDQHLAGGQFSARIEQNWQSGEKQFDYDITKLAAHLFPSVQAGDTTIKWVKKVIIFLGYLLLLD